MAPIIALLDYRSLAPSRIPYLTLSIVFTSATSTAMSVEPGDRRYECAIMRLWQRTPDAQETQQVEKRHSPGRSVSRLSTLMPRPA